MRRATIAPPLALIGSLAACAAMAAVSTAQVIAPPAPNPAPPAPNPPLVHTGYAPQVTTSSITVIAKVNPRGLATSYYFQYGPTAAYGSISPSASAGSGTQESPVTQVIAGLQPGTTYHYRAVAVSSAGTTDGLDATVTTKKIPLSLSIVVAPSPVVFGEPLSVSGTLSGTGNAGVGVSLQANPYPYLRGFQSIGVPQLTNAVGGFLFPLEALTQSTQLRVVVVNKPTVHSLASTERVTLHVTLHVRPAARHGFVRLYGTVTPAPTERRTRLAFERLTGDGRYVPVSGTLLKPGRGGASRFSRVVRLRHGVYRVLVEAHGALLSGRSRPVVIR
jgi:hypothetical protein